MPLRDKEKERAYHKAWRKKNPNKVRAYIARHRAKNPGVHRALSLEWRNRNIERARATSRAWAAANRERARDTKLRREYGITQSRFLEMLAEQQCTCPGCLTEITAKTACIDHCHKSGKVRGLLCARCNYAAGHAKDNPETLRRLALYLEGVVETVDARGGVDAVRLSHL